MSELYAVERSYPVSLERLWSAWTEAVELEKWYSPTDLSVVPGTVVSECHEGGGGQWLSMLLSLVSSLTSMAITHL